MVWQLRLQLQIARRRVSRSRLCEAPTYKFNHSTTLVDPQRTHAPQCNAIEQSAAEF